MNRNKTIGEILDCNLDIFRDSINIDCGNEISITGLFGRDDLIDIEAEMYFNLANNKEYLKYSLGYYVSSKEEALNKIIGCLMGKMTHLRFMLCIRYKNIPMGYITINSPLLEENDVKEWSISYFIGEQYSKKNIMTASLFNILPLLNKYEIKKVVTIIEEGNVASIKVMEKLHPYFKHVGISKDSRGFTKENLHMYEVNLTAIKFQ